MKLEAQTYQSKEKAYPSTISQKRPSTTHQNNLANSTQFNNKTSHEFKTRKSQDNTILPAVSYPNHQVNTKSFSQHPYWEKEKLFDLCIKLQTTVNQLNHQVKVERIKLHKKDDEISKQKALLKEIEENSKQSNENSQSNAAIQAKIRENTLISNLKQENKALQAQLYSKEEEFNEYKKKVKMTKIKEISLEVEVYEQEMIKMKQKLENALANAEVNNKKDKVIKEYQERIKRQNQKLNKLEYDNEKLVISNEAKVKEMNQEIENRNRTIARLEQEISKAKLREYYQDKYHDRSSDKSEEEMMKELALRTYQLFISMKKQNIPFESIQSCVLNKIDTKGKYEDIKIDFANNLIEMLHLTDLNDKASLLDLVSFYLNNEKDANKVSKKVYSSLKEFYDEEEKNKEKEKDKEMDLMELENLVKEKEKKLKYELFKIDSERKGIISFNSMREVIQKSGLINKEKDALIVSLKQNSFNLIEYKCLLDLAKVIEKFEYKEEEEVDQKQKVKEPIKEEKEEDNNNKENDVKQKDDDANDKENGNFNANETGKEKTNTNIQVNKEEEQENKDNDEKPLLKTKDYENNIIDNDKNKKERTIRSKSFASEKNKEEDFPSFYQIVYNIKLNEFTASEYFKSIVRLFDNVNSHLDQVEGIKQNEFLSFLKNKDIHIPSDECERLFKALKCKNIVEDDVLDAEKLEKELNKYMNPTINAESDVRYDENKDMMMLIPSSGHDYDKQKELGIDKGQVNDN